ncbi:MAG: hypothetical protein HQK57_01590 [Deltaproteobacteria bacterium]|nr:hypothetical protein [Deltaproteobacteria bacterium]
MRANSRLKPSGYFVPVLERKPDVSQISLVALERLTWEFRIQSIIFETERDVSALDIAVPEGDAV